MDIIKKEDLDTAKSIIPVIKEDAKIKEPSAEKFEEMMTELQNPVKYQKEMAIKIKIFLDHQIESEMRDKGILSEGTRRWIDIYYKALDKIQSAIHGDKSINLHLHKVSHSDVSDKIRASEDEIIEILPLDEKKKKKNRKSES